MLTHLRRMEFHTFINLTSPSISVLRVVGLYFSHFYSNLKRKFCLQTVESRIRGHILSRLIWFYTVSRCPTKRTLGLYGLIFYTMQSFVTILTQTPPGIGVNVV